MTSKTMAPSGHGTKETERIKDTTGQSFARDVLEESHRQPVLVDFWAKWCGPCRQFTPLMEKLVNAAGNGVKMVKINIDEHPAIAARTGIKSIPAVIAFKNGQPIDGFMGVLPENELKAFIERIKENKQEKQVQEIFDQAQAALDAGDPTSAARDFAAILQIDTGNVGAIAGLANCHVKLGALDQARQTLALAPTQMTDKPPISSTLAAIELAERSKNIDDTNILHTRINNDPDDFQARFNLALALNAANDREGAIDQLLHIIRRKRDWNDDAARIQMINFFDVWGPKDRNTITGRQQLASILFS